MNRIKCNSAFALLAAILLATPATAQNRKTAMIAGPAVLMDAPQGDASVLGQLPVGTVVQVVETEGTWCLVASRTQRGWIPVDALELPNGDRLRNPKHASGRFMVRAFGRAGGTLFTAHDSMDAVLGRPFKSVYGGGGQIVLPNGVFVEASMDRFRHDGTLVLGSGQQVFRISTPTRLTLTPVQATVGYRVANTYRLASYFGAGAGRYTLEESSPFTTGQSITKETVGYHVLGGAELKVLPWVWVGGEVQWATVPKALGDTGVSALFQEKDLGGTTFRFKLMFGS